MTVQPKFQIALQSLNYSVMNPHAPQTENLLKETDQQFQDVCDLNLLWSDERKDIPAFNMLVLMKVLGLLPPEMVCDSRSSDTDNNSSSDIYETLERKFGKVIR